LLWSRGGFRVHVDGPAALVERLKRHFESTPSGRFDADLMGQRVYEKPFEVRATQEPPPEKATTTPLGRHLDGCRIGFDLGGSDRKVAAVREGEAVFSEETVWDPYHQPIRSTTSTESWTRSGARPPICRAWTRLAGARRGCM